MIREQIMAALFAKVSAAATFKTVSRKFRHFSDMGAADQPALIQVQRGEDVTTVPGLPPVSVFDVDLLVYVNTGGDPSAAPSSVLNPLMDAVIASLAPDAVSNKQTLGGLVQHAWIEGRIETDEGLLQQQGYALIPVRIKAV